MENNRHKIDPERQNWGQIKEHYLPPGKGHLTLLSPQNVRLAKISGNCVSPMLSFSKRGPTPVPLLCVKCRRGISVVLLVLWSPNQEEVNSELMQSMRIWVLSPMPRFSDTFEGPGMRFLPILQLALINRMLSEVSQMESEMSMCGSSYFCMLLQLL